MIEYLNGVKSICDQLDCIGCPLSEHEMIYGALAGLGKEYESICTLIEHSINYVPELRFEDAVFKLVTFDDKLQYYNQPPETNPHMAFHNDHGYNPRGRGNSYRGGYNRGRGYNTWRLQPRPWLQHLLYKRKRFQLTVLWRFQFWYKVDVSDMLSLRSLSYPVLQQVRSRLCQLRHSSQCADHNEAV